MGIGWDLRRRNITFRTGLMMLLTVGISACGEEGFQGLNFGNNSETEEIIIPDPANGSIKLVERDVEAPEAFDVTAKALWDGRPSLGGVWVAHPASKQPERVIIRNPGNGKFVIGALFRRERNNPGPSLQLSSDAASVLGVLAGTPTELSVTALRRETVNVAEEVPAEQEAPAEQAPEPETVASTEIEPVSTSELESSVLASVQKAEAEKAAKKAAAAAEPKSNLDKPYVQIGFFSVEANAKANVASMKKNGIPAAAVKSTAKGKTFWRVIAGPASSAAARRQLLAMVKNQGFTDAYFVAN